MYLWFLGIVVQDGRVFVVGRVIVDWRERPVRACEVGLEANRWPVVVIKRRCVFSSII